MRILYLLQVLIELFYKSEYIRIPPTTLYHNAEEGDIGKVVHLIPIQNEFKICKKMT